MPEIKELEGAKPLTEQQIINILARVYFNPYQSIVVPNCYLPGWEADLLVMRRSGWLDEIEVKVTKADFRRDLTGKGDKHERLTKGIPARLPWNPAARCYPLDWSDTKPTIVRRFFYAMPHALAEEVIADLYDLPRHGAFA